MEIQKASFVGRVLLSLCPLALLVGFTSHDVRAQSAAVCGPAPAVKLALDGLPQQTLAQSDWQFHEQRAAAIQALRRQLPGDVFVQKAYIGSMYGRSDREKVIAEYKARHGQSPDNAQLEYL